MHLLPQQFKSFFQKAGIDIEGYTIPLKAGKHRLKAYNGVHTGKNNWNKVWNDWIGKNPNASEKQIKNQLEKMRREFDI